MALVCVCMMCMWHVGLCFLYFVFWRVMYPIVKNIHIHWTLDLVFEITGGGTSNSAWPHEIHHYQPLPSCFLLNHLFTRCYCIGTTCAGMGITASPWSPSSPIEVRVKCVHEYRWLFARDHIGHRSTTQEGLWHAMPAEPSSHKHPRPARHRTYPL